MFNSALMVAFVIGFYLVSDSVSAVLFFNLTFHQSFNEWIRIILEI